MIADHDLKKAICPGCFTEVRIDVLFEERTSWHDINVDGSDRYWVLKCRGCDGIFFGHGYSFSENTDYLLNENTGEWHLEYVEEKTFYPRALKRNKPEWFDRRFSIDNSEIYAILYEVYSALDHELFSVGAMGIRTVFDLLAIKLGTLTSLSFSEKIEKLRSAGHITGREKTYLETLTDAGGAAAHRGWRPNSEEFMTLLEILEGSIHRSLILPAKVDKLKKSVPAKQT